MQAANGRFPSKTEAIRYPHNRLLSRQHLNPQEGGIRAPAKVEQSMRAFFYVTYEQSYIFR